MLSVAGFVFGCLFVAALDRCQTLGDGDEKDRPENLCVQPVSISPALKIPRCMDMISSADVIRAIELHYQGGALQYLR